MKKAANKRREKNESGNQHLPIQKKLLRNWAICVAHWGTKI